MKKILIVKTSALGDIIHAFAVADYLKEKFPLAVIDWVAEKGGAPIVQANPSIHKTYVIDTKSWRKGRDLNGLRLFIKYLRQTHYDLLIDLQGNLKSGLVTGFAKADQKVGFGRETVPEWPNTFFTKQKYNPPAGKNIREDYLYLVKSHLNEKSEHTGQKTVEKLEDVKGLPIMVCPGSNWANKTLSKETLQGFLDKIAEQLPESRFQFIWGTPEEKVMVESMQSRYSGSIVLDRMSLPDLQKKMRSMRLVIAMDSLPLHLAGTTSALTYSVFGPSSAAKYNPMGLKHHALQGACPYGESFEKRCPILRTCPTGACMKDLTPDMIWNDFWPWFKNYI